MNITYKTGFIPATAQIVELYNDSGLKRPTDDADRIELMYKNSNLVVSAWDNEKLVGVARSLTDYCYSCYLADLAVAKVYQKAGIGKELVALTQLAIGDQTSLLLQSARTAVEYYPKIGMERIENGFIINRKR